MLTINNYSQLSRAWIPSFSKANVNYNVPLLAYLLSSLEMT